MTPRRSVADSGCFRPATLVVTGGDQSVAQLVRGVDSIGKKLILFLDTMAFLRLIVADRPFPRRDGGFTTGHK